MITIELLYWIAFLMPLLIMPIVLPMVVLMAHRKRLTDSPNARKLQSQPVPVMGGTVMMLASCASLIVLNLFYDISGGFSIMCVMVIMYIFGMLDDINGLSWQFKFVIQIFTILLIFFGGDCGIHSLHGLFGIWDLSMPASCLFSLFMGLLLLNAVNFSDGIDGLASGLGIFICLMLGLWQLKHGVVIQTLFSFTMVGTLTGFFVFNVFSKRFKMYMGDSGSLVLGICIYALLCTKVYLPEGGTMLADKYLTSFHIAIISYMVFDLVRVAMMRVLNGKSPFEPDRTHLHHMYVDLGANHLTATMVIIFNNLAMIGVWYATALTGMNEKLQYTIILLSGFAFFWFPYFIVTYLRDHRPEKYEKLQKPFKKISAVVDKISEPVSRIIDLKRH